jgi:hypothetical protein
MKASGKQATDAPPKTTRAAPAAAPPRDATGLLELQRTVGNRAVQRLLSTPGVVQRRAIPSAAASATPQATTAGELGAPAFAYGDRIAFASRADLWTAAHEDAHAVQQRSGAHPTATTSVPASATRHGAAGMFIQPKLIVGAINDPLEHEADRVADQVMRIPDRELSVGAAPMQLNRKCAACEADEQLLRKRSDVAEPATAEAPSIVHEVLRSPAQPLDAATRAYFEPRFGRDLSRVRVHSGTAADQSARELNARAYTVGHDIVFGAGRYAPHTSAGRHLLAHELTHVVQQGKAGISTRMANEAASASGGHTSSQRVLQRAPDETKGTAPAAVPTAYPEEAEVLLYAARALAANSMADGAVFYKTIEWSAMGLSSSTFVVGPITTDMGQLFYAYRWKSSAGQQGKYVFSRGTYSGRYLGQMTPALHAELAKVAGTKDLEVQLPGSGFSEPRESLPFMMMVWQARGELDPSRLPAGAPRIPPLPITKDQAKELKAHLSGPAAALLIGGAVVTQAARSGAQTVLGGTTAAELGTTFARGTGTFEAVTEESAASALEEEGGVVVGRAVGTARVGAAAAAFAAVILYESSAPYGTSSDTVSDITGTGRASPGEYQWETQLTRDQLRHLHDLWQQRYKSPAPVPSGETQPVPTTETQTEPESKRRRRRNCRDLAGPPCPSRMTRLTTPNEYWNLAYNYRRENNLLGQYDFGQNIAVLLLDDGPPIREKNSDKLHSEQMIAWTLQKRKLGPGCPIVGLFSERKPCQEICQKIVLPYLCQQNSNVPFNVFYAIEYYNSPEGIKSENNRHELIKSYTAAGYFPKR